MEMPYKIEKKGDQHCVVKEDDGKQIACHDSRSKALAQVRALYANEKADLAALSCAAGDCSRQFFDFDAMLGHLEKVHGEEAREVKTGERKNLAGKGQAIIGCPECDRAFLSEDLLFEHAEAVHTFDDIQRLVSEVVREKYHEHGDYRASPPVPSVWAWVQDLATDWVVFSVEKDGDTTLYKASYSITDGAVTLGEPTEVRRRTVYEPVKEDS